MLTMLGTPRRTCDGLTRRETLTAGAVCSLAGGLDLSTALRAEASAGTARPRKAKNLVTIYLLGGAATQDMFDLKPNAPAEVRGEFKPAATTVPGLQISEQLPRLSGWMHKAALVRSVTHQAGCHNPLPGLAGHEVPPPDIVSTKDTYPPSIGSVLEYLRTQGKPPSPTEMPGYVWMPCYLGWGQAIRRPGPYGGYLGRAFDPVCTEVMPYVDPGVSVVPGRPGVVRGVPEMPSSRLAAEMTLDRFDRRRGLLTQFDEQLRRAEESPALAGYDRTQQRAFQVITSPQARAAFDLDREPPAVRDRYGRTLFGNSTLIARRLLEAGVRFVNVTWDLFWDRVKADFDAWDTHQRNYPILRQNLPQLDLTLTALMEDLDDRGMLDETLILILSEMGRTPKINANGGRDHWTYCYSTFLAGGGVRGGTVVGASDGQAAFVKDRPTKPAEILATAYSLLGIDPDTTVPDKSGRPIAVAQGARVIDELV
jgi:uncharacterized protein (DUF1501 family)